jgi:uncharacterized membrane protein YkoI
MKDKLKKILLAVVALAALAMGGGAIAGATSGSGTDTPAKEQGQPAEGAENTNESATESADAADKGSADDEHGDSLVTGADADRAKAAALDATKGGTARDVERTDENGAGYDVEVTKADGSQVDVQLDAGFKVLGIEGHGHEDSGSEADATGGNESTGK